MKDKIRFSTATFPQPLAYLDYPGFVREMCLRKPPLLARLFGKRIVGRDGGFEIHTIYWRGTVYVVSEKRCT